MAFDGITVAAVAQELSAVLTGGRITKIAQPEADELLLTIKTPAGTNKLYILPALRFLLYILQMKTNKAP